MPSCYNEVKVIMEKDNLIAHPEGGYYIQTYKSSTEISVPSRYKGSKTRPEFTKINYLLIKNDFSAWHKVSSDEIFRFREGTSLMLHIIDRNGRLNQIKIGDPTEENDAVSEYLIEHSQWFAASVNDKNSFSYVECEVRPGFMFDDFELGKSAVLIKQHPQHAEIIERYSRILLDELPKVSHSNAI
ncbi:MAG: cupin domain-containing protein [Legionellales bacterium]|nr:cupin domain-containing protein [Legionellales bacterium]